MKSDAQKFSFLRNLFFKINHYSLDYKDVLEYLDSEIISFNECNKQIKTFKNLITQLEKSQKYNSSLDRLYMELIFLSVAYEHAVYISNYEESYN